MQTTDQKLQAVSRTRIRMGGRESRDRQLSQHLPKREHRVQPDLLAKANRVDAEAGLLGDFAALHDGIQRKRLIRFLLVQVSPDVCRTHHDVLLPSEVLTGISILGFPAGWQVYNTHKK